MLFCLCVASKAGISSSPSKGLISTTRVSTTTLENNTFVTVIAYLEAWRSYRVFHVPSSAAPLVNFRESITFDLEIQSSSQDSRWKWRGLKLSREEDSMGMKELPAARAPRAAPARHLRTCLPPTRLPVPCLVKRSQPNLSKNHPFLSSPTSPSNSDDESGQPRSPAPEESTSPRPSPSTERAPSTRTPSPYTSTAKAASSYSPTT